MSLEGTKNNPLILFDIVVFDPTMFCLVQHGGLWGEEGNMWNHLLEISPVRLQLSLLGKFPFWHCWACTEDLIAKVLVLVWSASQPPACFGQSFLPRCRHVVNHLFFFLYNFFIGDQHFTSIHTIYIVIPKLFSSLFCFVLFGTLEQITRKRTFPKNKEGVRKNNNDNNKQISRNRYKNN